MSVISPGNVLAMSVVVQHSVSSPVPLGSTVTLKSHVSDAQEGTVWYRYRVRTPDATDFRTVRDYSPESQFNWVPMRQEGSYDIEVAARNLDTGDTAYGTRTYQITPVAADAPVVTPTRHPLVFLYSAPACNFGMRLRVEIDGPDGSRQFTPWQACAQGKTVNIYLAGMRAETQYTARQIISDGQTTTQGPPISFQTGVPGFSPAATSVLQKPAAQIRQDVLLQSKVFDLSVALDIDGNVIWYIPDAIRYLTRPEPGGYFWVLLENDAGGDADQKLRLIDLAGNTVLETNAARINEQLQQRGMNPITSFHHEARSLPDGRILVLAATERVLTDVQGEGDVDVLGDMILVLDRDLQVIWEWDAFDHLDQGRKAVLDEKCVLGQGGCSRFTRSDQANDWLHGNALQLTPDNNIIYSSRHQDWVIKINYSNGQGFGNVIWRLGRDGDFQMASGDDSLWFSHQHDPNFEGTDRLAVFDNGNTRQAEDENAHSRGQVLDIDESNRVVSLALNVDLGAFSTALGSAQKLTNGNYHFNLGWMPNTFSQALEYDPSGALVTQVQTETQMYRSFRMRDLYTPQ